MPEILHSALNLLAFEDKHGTAVAPQTRFPDPSKVAPTEYVEAMRSMFKRLSEWMDAVIHWDARLHYATCPKSMTDDELHNELYAVGLMQAGFARLSEHGKDWWKFRHDSLALKTPLEK